MAVAVAYRNNHNNYFNNSVGGLLAKTGIDILGKLLGDEFNAMRERAANANRVNAFRGIMGALNGTGGENGSTVPTTQEPMSKYDYLTKFLAHPDFAKLSKEQQESLYGYAGVGGQEKGYRDYLENTPEGYKDVAGRVVGQARTNPNGNITDVANTGLLDRTNPKTNFVTVDLGDRKELLNIPEYGGYSPASKQAVVYNGIDPTSAAQIEANNKIAKGNNATQIRVANIAASARGQGGRGRSGYVNFSLINNLQKQLDATNTAIENIMLTEKLTESDKMKLRGLITTRNQLGKTIEGMTGVNYNDQMQDAYYQLVSSGKSQDVAAKTVQAAYNGVKANQAPQQTKKSVYSKR